MVQNWFAAHPSSDFDAFIKESLKSIVARSSRLSHIVTYTSMRQFASA